MNANEERAFEMYYNSRRRTEKRNLRYFLAQKFCALLLIGVGIVSAIFLGDATINVITLPLGIYLLFTRQKVMNF